MKEFQIMLKTPKEIVEFNKVCLKQSEPVTLKSGHYVVDGKSIVGIYSLDLSKPITVECGESVDLLDFAKAIIK